MLGNSVARHWAFIMVDLLLHNVTSSTGFSKVLREDEKHRCGAGGVFGGARPQDVAAARYFTRGCFGLCGCDFRELDAVLRRERALTFGWIWSIASNWTEAALSETRGPDIVVFNAGMPSETCPPCGSDLSVVREQGPLLRRSIATFLAAKPDARFYWRSTTATCGSWEQFNEKNAALNRAIERHICGAHADPRLRYLDGFNWTEGRCDEYDDQIHHSRAAFTQVVTWLRAECNIA